MGLKFVSLCTQITVLVFVIGKSDGIQCFDCQATISESGEDPCRHATLKTCPPGNNRCISAKFSGSASDTLASLMKDPLQQNDERIVTTLACLPDAGGQECEMLLELMKYVSPHINFKYHEKCKICSTDGCNSAPAKKLSTLLFVAACFISFANLFIFYDTNN